MVRVTFALTIAMIVQFVITMHIMHIKSKGRNGKRAFKNGYPKSVKVFIIVGAITAIAWVFCAVYEFLLFFGVI